MASFVYNQFKAELMNGTYRFDKDLTSSQPVGSATPSLPDTVKVALMATGHSSSASTNVGWSSVSSNEMTNTSGSAYTADGKTLTNLEVSQESTHGKLDADNISWTSATFTAHYAVLYDDTPTSPADPLICSIDFSGGQQVTNGTFTIEWAAGGIITIT